MSSRDDISLSLYFRTILDRELTDKTRFSPNIRGVNLSLAIVFGRLPFQYGAGNCKKGYSAKFDAFTRFVTIFPLTDRTRRSFIAFT